jgi:hypothetical protein
MMTLKLTMALMLLAGMGCSYLRWNEPYSAARFAVRDLASVHQILQTADRASPHVLLTDIGRVVYGDFEAPFWYVAYRPFQADLKRVLLLAGAQGDATAGVDYLLNFVRTLAAAPSGSVAYDLDILPIVNPWGYTFNLPLNRKGVDIEDDFSSFDSSEARVIRRFLREKQYDLVIDLWEDPDAAGFFVWQYGLNDEQVSARVVSRIRSDGFAVENHPEGLLLKPRQGIIAAPMWGLKLLHLSGRMTLAGYVRQNVSASVYTVVTPQRRPPAERVAMQGMAVETILDAYRQPNP